MRNDFAKQKVCQKETLQKLPRFSPPLFSYTKLKFPQGFSPRGLIVFRRFWDLALSPWRHKVRGGFSPNDFARKRAKDFCKNSSEKPILPEFFLKMLSPFNLDKKFCSRKSFFSFPFCGAGYYRIRIQNPGGIFAPG